MNLFQWIPFKRKASDIPQKPAKPAGPKPLFKAQEVSRLYCLAAMAIFAVQSIVATYGALDLVIPDFPSPIPYEYGRSIHLGMAVLWPLIGTMGLAYFFTSAELNREIYSPKLARWQFWLTLIFVLGIFGSLSFRIGNGREFLEGLPIFYMGVCLALALASYNLIRTLFSDKNHITPAAAIMTVGTLFLLVLLLPNTITYTNPIMDEATKYWVVHLWEEMAFELTEAGFIAAFFVVTGLAPRSRVEKWLYLESAMSVVGGLYATGHHYYWIGFPAVWLVIGSLLSLLEILPIALLVQITYTGLKSVKLRSNRIKLTLWLMLSSLFYHVVGGALLGILMTIPWVNLYSHGTYITSGHAHLALFGTLGFLVISGCYYVLSCGSELSASGYKVGILAVILLNLGLIIMGSALLVAGFIETYLWRILGIDFMQVHIIIIPYLILRVLGGSLFALGDLLFFWRIFKTWKMTRPAKSSKS